MLLWKNLNELPPDSLVKPLKKAEYIDAHELLLDNYTKEQLAWMAIQLRIASNSRIASMKAQIKNAVEKQLSEREKQLLEREKRLQEEEAAFREKFEVVQAAPLLDAAQVLPHVVSVQLSELKERILDLSKKGRHSFVLDKANLCKETAEALVNAGYTIENFSEHKARISWGAPGLEE